MSKGRREGKGHKQRVKRKKAAAKARKRDRMLAQLGTAETTAAVEARRAGRSAEVHEMLARTEPPKVGKWVRDLTPAQRDLFDRANALLVGRVDGKRLTHSYGVSKTAAKMAKAYGVDVWLAGLAGLVHDWNKCLTADELIAQGHAIGFDFPEGHERDVLPLLHGPTAAVAISHMLPEVPHEALQAVSRHTTGAIGMTDLDMVVYIADMIEPGRSFHGVDELRAIVCKATLVEVYQACYAQSMESLFARGRYVYLPAVGIWNDLVAKRASE